VSELSGSGALADALFGFGSPRAVFMRGADESREERMRLERLRFEFRVELAAETPGMVGQLANFDVNAIGGLAGDP